MDSSNNNTHEPGIDELVNEIHEVADPLSGFWAVRGQSLAALERGPRPGFEALRTLFFMMRLRLRIHNDEKRRVFTNAIYCKGRSGE